MSAAVDPGAQASLPIGPPVDTAPARRPEPVVLEGRFGRVEECAYARELAHDAR